MRVDVVVAGNVMTGGRAQVSVAASGVRLISSSRLPGGGDEHRRGQLERDPRPVATASRWKLIEAENFAREVRLIPVEADGGDMSPVDHIETLSAELRAGWSRRRRAAAVARDGDPVELPVAVCEVVDRYGAPLPGAP